MAKLMDFFQHGIITLKDVNFRAEKSLMRQNVAVLRKSILKHGNWNIGNASVGKSLWKKMNSETDKEPKSDQRDIYM